MRQLIWKELREQRYIPVAHAGIVAVVILVWYAMAAWEAAHYPSNRPLTATETVLVLYLGLCILGLFSGSGAFAPEIGSGTLAFLATSPTGRPRIWRAKVAAGCITMAASAGAVLVAYALTTVVLFGATPLWNYPANQDLPWLLAISLICGIYGYSVCLFVSSIVDRTIVAASIGLVTACAGLAALGGLMSAQRIRTIYAHDGELLVMMILALPAIAFSIASYVGFCSGAILLPASRFRRAAAVLTSGLTISAIILMLVGVAMNEAAAAIEARQLAMMPHAEVIATRHDPATTVRIVFPKGTTASEYKLDIGILHGPDLTHVKRPAVSVVFTAPKSDGFIDAHLRNAGDLAIKVHRHTTPGTYHERLNLLDKAGATVHVVDIESVTE